jgi:hypothetical protein
MTNFSNPTNSFHGLVPRRYYLIQKTTTTTTTITTTTTTTTTTTKLSFSLVFMKNQSELSCLALVDLCGVFFEKIHRVPYFYYYIYYYN